MLGSAGTPTCEGTGELQYLLAFLRYAGGDSIRGSLAHSCGGHLPSNAAEDLDRELFERLMGTHPRRLRSAVLEELAVRQRGIDFHLAAPAHHPRVMRS